MSVASVTAIIAAISSSQEEEEKQEKQEEQEEEGVQFLLLGGNEDIMEISENEKVLLFCVSEDYQGNNTWLWNAELNEKFLDMKSKTFNECIQKIMEEYQPHSIQIIPFSVRHNHIDCYSVMIKVLDKDKIQREKDNNSEKEENLSQMLEKMSEDLKYEW